MSQPFWERSYGDPDAETFGAPAAEIVRLADVLPPGASVLDIGCGDGRNALFLAGQGFRVEAFDLSEAGIRKLERMAAAKELVLSARVDDVVRFEFGGVYNLIVCHGVLHLLERPDWRRVLARMKSWTAVGGRNVVAVFTDELAPPPDLEPFMKGLFRKGELARLYAEWEAEECESYLLEDEHPGGVRHTHAIDRIVARRPG